MTTLSMYSMRIEHGILVLALIQDLLQIEGTIKQERVNKDQVIIDDISIYPEVMPKKEDAAEEVSNQSEAAAGNGDAEDVVHGREEALRCIISKEECTGDEHQDTRLGEGDADAQGLESFNLHSNQKKVQLWCENAPSTVRLEGNVVAVATNSIKQTYLRNVDSAQLSECEEEESGMCEINNDWNAGHVSPSCCQRENVPMLGGAEVVQDVDVNTMREDNAVDFGDNSGRQIERNAMLNEVQVFQGNTCGDEFITKESIQKHLSVHSVKFFKCSLCTKRFIHKKDYERHIFIQHQIRLEESEPIGEHNSRSVIDFVDQCDTKFNVVASRKFMDEDTDERSYTCNICTKSFTMKSKLKAHMTEMHLENMQHLCTVCSKSFSREGSLSKHMMSHMRKCPYFCSICSKSFATESILMVHQMIHNAITKKCNLNSTMLVHLDDRPHSCDLCLKCFMTKGMLKRHMAIHLGKKPHSYSVCSKQFATKGSLKSHMVLRLRKKRDLPSAH